LSKEGVVEH